MMNTYYKYCQVDLPQSAKRATGRENENFRKLLIYIGESHKEKGRSTNKIIEHEYIGIAYELIRNETNKLLGLTWRDLRLRTSKREISSIRYYFGETTFNRRQRYTKIPLKAVYIFRAIVNILEEIWNRPNAPIIPADLHNCINLTYAMAFYKTQIEAYDNAYQRNLISREQVAKLELHNDFYSPKSPFRKTFKK